MLLSVSHSSAGGSVESKRFAVNDVIVSHENFLGICKNIGYLHANDEPLDSSPYATFALQIYAMGH